MGRADLIGNGQHHLIPRYQPTTGGNYLTARRKNSTRAVDAASNPSGPGRRVGNALLQPGVALGGKLPRVNPVKSASRSLTSAVRKKSGKR